MLRVIAGTGQRVVELGARGAQPEIALEQLHAVADAVEIRRIELLGLHEHVLAHAHLAEVVQQRGVAQLHQLVVAEFELAVRSGLAAIDDLGEPDREVSHAERVARRGGVACFDRGHRRLHESLEQLANRQVQPAVVDGHRGLRGEGARQLFVPRAVGPHVPLDVVGAEQPRRAIVFAVDELQRADRLPLRRLHGDHEHRLGAIPGILVEPTVDREGRVLRRRVGVGEIDHVAGDRDVPGDAAVGQGQGGRPEGDRHAVVLCEGEAQVRRLAALLDDVQ